MISEHFPRTKSRVLRLHMGAMVGFGAQQQKRLLWAPFIVSCNSQTSMADSKITLGRKDAES